MLLINFLLITCIQLLSINGEVLFNVDYIKLNNDLNTRLRHDNDDLFSSLDHMQLLIHSHQEITIFIKQVIQYQHKQLYLAKQMLYDFELITNSSLADKQRFVSNPVNLFLLTKKLTTDFEAFVDLSKSFWPTNLEIDLNKKIFSNKIIMPTNKDYEGVIKAIHRLQKTYLLDSKDIRAGNFSLKYPVTRSLNAFECFEFGRIAYNRKDYKYTNKWMTEALNLINLEGNKTYATEEDILDYLAFAKHQEGEILEAVKLSKQLLKINPNNDRIKHNLKHYENYYNKIQSSKNLTNKNNDVLLKTTSLQLDNLSNTNLIEQYDVYDVENYVYKRLCRGDFLEKDTKASSLTEKTLNLYTNSLILKAQKRKSMLKCYYVSNNNPFLLIGPIKQEKIFVNPDIWIYYDVITESQIQIMKNLALPKLKRAIVTNPVTGQDEIAEYRISKSGWLKDKEHYQLSYLTKLVESITNLSLKTAEEWQIGNYGIGGQYDPHFDFAMKDDPNPFDESIGNRIATWLFYLEVPEKGGATVFPRVGARVQPTRRSAAFWYNLYSNGDGDLSTRHAACPVLYGVKWVSNKWIHERDQEFKRPCENYLNKQKTFFKNFI